ncbi:hypothetical protein [Pseudooceanicola sp. MF1-13]|uniref:hypothetical protein n=1 Tax=Pseudooceanicola sp. MF1-13 TaxID=3379095 RepID=UPI0038913A82
MQVLAIGTKSPNPVLSKDGAYIHIAPANGHLVIDVSHQLTDPISSEIKDFRKGRFSIGWLPVATATGSFPLIVVQLGTLVLEMPYCLGLENPAVRDEIVETLSKVSQLNDKEAWPVHLELIDRADRVTRGLRMVGVSPAFWQSLAQPIIDSANVTRRDHEASLARFFDDHPSEHFVRAKLQQMPSCHRYSTVVPACRRCPGNRRPLTGDVS